MWSIYESVLCMCVCVYSCVYVRLYVCMCVCVCVCEICFCTLKRKNAPNVLQKKLWSILTGSNSASIIYTIRPMLLSG
jgi:hypothetical protein